MTFQNSEDKFYVKDQIMQFTSSKDLLKVLLMLIKKK